MRLSLKEGTALLAGLMMVIVLPSTASASEGCGVIKVQALKSSHPTCIKGNRSAAHIN
ncbi:MAG: hypothetical protein ACSLFI_10580 [Solirubrobacterales bacterium]